MKAELKTDSIKPPYPKQPPFVVLSGKVQNEGMVTTKNVSLWSLANELNWTDSFYLRHIVPPNNGTPRRFAYPDIQSGKNVYFDLEFRSNTNWIGGEDAEIIRELDRIKRENYVSVSALAENYGVGNKTISEWLNKFGLVYVQSGRECYTNKESEAKLDELINHRMLLYDLLNEFGYSKDFHKSRIENGTFFSYPNIKTGKDMLFPISKEGDGYWITEVYAKKIRRLENLKKTKFTRLLDFADKVGYSNTAIRGYCKELDIKIYNCTDSYLLNSDCKRIEDEKLTAKIKKREQLGLVPYSVSVLNGGKMLLSIILRMAKMFISSFEKKTEKTVLGRNFNYPTFEDGVPLVKKIPFYCDHRGIRFMSNSDAQYIIKQEKIFRSWPTKQEFTEMTGVSERSIREGLHLANNTLTVFLGKNYGIFLRCISHLRKVRVCKEDAEMIASAVSWLDRDCACPFKFRGAEALEKCLDDKTGFIHLTRTYSLFPWVDDDEFYNIGVRFARLPSMGFSNKDEVLIRHEDARIVKFYLGLLNGWKAADEELKGLLAKVVGRRWIKAAERAMLWIAKYLAIATGPKENSALGLIYLTELEPFLRRRVFNQPMPEEYLIRPYSEYNALLGSIYSYKQSLGKFINPKGQIPSATMTTPSQAEETMKTRVAAELP